MQQSIARNSRFLLALIACGAYAQAPKAPLEFEVASIKPAAPVTGHHQYHLTMKTDAGQVTIANASLLDLLCAAHKVKADQISGPDWLPSEKFDVVAKLPAGSTPAQFPEMLRALLPARFQLQTHVEKKEIRALALELAKGGDKLQETDPNAGPARSGWSREMNPDGSMRITARAISMPAFGDLVGSFLGVSVRDKTELKGVYDIAIDLSPGDLRTGTKTVGLMVDPETAGDTAGSSVYSSLQKVGLKLESQKLLMDVIVIDHTERRPTEN
jgi:uncharacterized protein (TIGR03435 family)